MPWYSHPRHWFRLKDGARSRRADETPAEAELWQQLRGRKLGVNFRREHAIGPYVADFFAPAHNLIVEVDGPVHERRRDRDAARDSYLEAEGFHVLRFTNDEVLFEMPGVLAAIQAAIAQFTS